MMKLKKIAACSVAATAMFASSPVLADFIPISRQVELTFNGTVTQSAGETLIVTDAQGHEMPFNVDLADFPIKVGDPFTYSYRAGIPTAAFFETFDIPLDDDGLYRVRLFLDQVTGGSFARIGDVTGLTLSGPLFPTEAITGGGPGSFHTLAIDPVTNEVFIDHEAGFANKPYSGPFLVFNSETETYELCGNCLTTIFENTGSIPDPLEYRLTGNAMGTELSFSAFIPTTLGGIVPGAGSYSLVYSGNWNLPSLSSRSTTAVPEPGILLLFGAGAAGLVARRRFRK